MITWDEKYETGEEQLDRHHKMLFEFFNDFEIEINEGRGQAYVERSMKFVEYYADCHFGIEEFCMDRYRCPFAQNNKQAHASFKKGVADFKDRINTAGYTDQVAVQMHEFFEDWITGHIVAIDTKLRGSIS